MMPTHKVSRKEETLENSVCAFQCLRKELPKVDTGAGLLPPDSEFWVSCKVAVPGVLSLIIL